MTPPDQSLPSAGIRLISVHPTARQKQRGVVLIIALIMMLVISLLTVTSMRNVASSERVSGNVRTTELATQAADIALRHCEASVVKITDLVTINSLDLPTSKIAAAGANTWQSLTSWDTTTTPFPLDSSLVGGTATFARPPECMAEFLTGAAGSRPASFVITARGFGPEVRTAAGAGRPVGTVVWLQSTLDIK